MHGTDGRCERVARQTLLLASLLACASPAFALDPALDISQYAHRSWRVRDGFGRGAIHALAQTPDGYLWLGTEDGLLRFDGVRTVPRPEPAEGRLPSNVINSLLAGSDGTLWIGTSNGLARWKDGRVTSSAELAGYYVFALLEDREGVVWAGGTTVPTGKLCAIRKDAVECHGDDGRFGRGVFEVHEDRRGNLWAGVYGGIWRWRPGPPRFYGIPSKQTVNGLGEDDDGAILLGGMGGVLRFVDGKTEPYSRPGFRRDLVARRILRDRNGGLWFATQNQGVIHVRGGRADSFTHPDGLSSDVVNAFLEDREGNVWVATDAGLDRFRDPAVATFSRRQGVSSTGVYAVVAARDGTVWCASSGGLNRWMEGRMTVPRTGSATPDGKVDGLMPHSLFQDGRGRLWITTARGIGHLENERFTPVPGVPGGIVRSIAEDTAGTLWLANQDAGLIGLSSRGVVTQIPWRSLGHEDFATALMADTKQGGLWLGFFRGGIAYVRDGRVRASYGAGDGLGPGYVTGFRTARDGAIWVATEGGLTRLKDGRLATLSSKNGLPCDGVHWVMEDDESPSLWIYTACGLVRVARSEIDGWATDASRAIRGTLFDLSDGVRSHSVPGGMSPIVSRSSDGRLWFLPFAGVSVLDPRRLPANSLPPPVHIEQVTADRKSYEASAAAAGGLRLPALVRDLQIDYTALSLAAPEKVRFRYRLDGRDHDWQDGGTRRQVFYNDLPPGHYRFRMTASNNSGVWNEAGTSLDLSIAPAYYQTAWFRLAGLAALGAVVAAFYRLRLRQATRQVRARMEARIEERERIARDLHDTLLQGVQGLILKFHAVAKRIPAGDPVRHAIEETLDRADEVLAEGRDRVRSLRTGTALRDLPAALERVAREAAVDGTARFTSVVEGRPRELDPIVLEESFAIGREALLNAMTHSRGVHMEMEIAYDPRQLRLRIRDDGRGIDEEVLRTGGRSDHWGIQGMRERALRIGARLEIWSRPGAGTEVELTVPAATAYREARTGSPASRVRPPAPEPR